jgi:integrase
MGKLTILKVKNLKTPGRYGDGHNLWLQISEGGGKSWAFRYTRAGRGHQMGLGPVDLVSLAEAREKARECRKMLLDGIDPIEDRRMKLSGRNAKAVTFAEAAKRYIAAHEASWRNEKHRYQWTQTLTNYAGPVIGALDVAKIETNHILQVLEPIWIEKADTATRLRGRIEAVLDWCKVRGLREAENPARWKGHLKHLLPARNKQNGIKHYSALPWREMPAFMAELRAFDTIGSKALQFTILSATRTGETIGAQWPEVDFENRVWAIRAQRMKAGKEHRVPLSVEALAILEDMPRFDGNPFIFPGAKKARGLSNLAMLMTLRRIRPNLTVHGFRSSFRDWAGEATNHPREVCEQALAHTVNNQVERAYRRGDALEKRRALMQDWADYLDGLKSDATGNGR